MAGNWRETAELYFDKETGLVHALGPFTIRRANEGAWIVEGPYPADDNSTYDGPFDAYRAMVDCYEFWWHARPAPVVYIIGETGEIGTLVKIGVSISAEQRLRHLQIGSPVPLKILASIPGDFDDEQRLHHRFRTERRHGEWFMVGKRLRAFIEKAGR